MQQVRALGRMPVETDDLKERLLARSLREARNTGSMIPHDAELESITAADEGSTAHKTCFATLIMKLMRQTHRNCWRTPSDSWWHSSVVSALTPRSYRVRTPKVWWRSWSGCWLGSAKPSGPTPPSKAHTFSCVATQRAGHSDSNATTVAISW